MTKRTLYTLLAFVTACVIILLTAYSQGADPLHPRTRHIWLVSLVAAAYFSWRVVPIIMKLMGSAENKSPSAADNLFFGKTHAIDKRMADRKARLAAAKEKQGLDEDSPDTKLKDDDQ